MYGVFKVFIFRYLSNIRSESPRRCRGLDLARQLVQPSSVKSSSTENQHVCLENLVVFMIFSMKRARTARISWIFIFGIHFVFVLCSFACCSSPRAQNSRCRRCSLFFLRYFYPPEMPDCVFFLKRFPGVWYVYRFSWSGSKATFYSSTPKSLWYRRKREAYHQDDIKKIC